ncbi:DNA-binding protein [Vibrio splendidus]|uniref:DNA-binding protein n=1 Tax=Vibrio TaxID=662 RepID=UPI0018E470EE|nr:DNA-binding protein [Vibrio splendidus]
MKKSYNSKHDFDHPFFHLEKEERIVNGQQGALAAGYRPYSKEEDDFIIDNYQKIPFTQMAKRFGRSSRSVYVRSKKLIRDGLINHNDSWRNSHYTREEDNYIFAMQDKMSLLQVSQVLGRSRSSVKVRASKLGISYQKISETSPVVKLSNEDIEMIRELEELGLNYCEIADKFEVDSSYVRRVCLFESRLYQDKKEFLSTKARQVSAIDGQD